MINAAIHQIINSSQEYGWVMEPQAKEIFRLAGLPVPQFIVVKDITECGPAAKTLGYPLAAKVVSPEIIHKTEHQGVVVNIGDLAGLKDVFIDLSGLPGFQGVLLEKMSSGVELILGAKNDPQFGPVVLLGIGGIGVEIYKDTAIRMAPVATEDVDRMISELKGRKLLEGYRGAPAVNRTSLIETVRNFSLLSMELATHFESIDINPLFCAKDGCFVADARIILRQA
ncbi:MAG: acetate--CoA ligase family protein [Proteobacteria bacterium]|nr:acetate--CoA ligase family protein [Pseudomonadota bacterium]MBU1715295.1 acetate--CoA ligase family protein [Pseudomonadota bacterium]